MAKIQTFELDRWSEPDENHRVKHIGMADAKETFDKLKTHLEAHGLLPDEYFSFSGKYEGLTGELPEFEEALCIPNFGSSEGIYLDTLTSSSDIKQKELLKHEIVEMGGFALSGEVVERQFYIKIWDRTVDGVERDLLQKLKYLSGYFADCGIQTEILEQQDIVRLCNLVNNPAYVHLEDAGFEAAIPILESVGVV